MFQFDLACEDWKRTLVGTVHVAGVFGALPVTAFISDTYVRNNNYLPNQSQLYWRRFPVQPVAAE